MIYTVRPPLIEAYQFKDEQWRLDPELPAFVKRIEKRGHLISPPDDAAARGAVARYLEFADNEKYTMTTIYHHQYMIKERGDITIMDPWAFQTKYELYHNQKIEEGY